MHKSTMTAIAPTSTNKTKVQARRKRKAREDSFFLGRASCIEARGV